MPPKIKQHIPEFDLVVGLEVHVQLSTQSKVFSSDSAQFSLTPNDNTGIITLGLPGTLPRLNEIVLQSAIKLGIALNGTINQRITFDRKNYFYPDLPKGYQITQDINPIVIGGSLPIVLKDSSTKYIRIHHIHIEEDAGKSIHDDHTAKSLIDLNRAGVALLEIVTEPDFVSAEETILFLIEIQKIVRYLQISDGNMEQGSIRCDANISIKPLNDNVLGVRCEVKNMNSYRNLKRAINYEFERQKKEVISGEKIIQNTLHFDEVSGKTWPMRSKEMTHDYRYFPEPDLLPCIISDKQLIDIKNNMPLLPNQLFLLYTTNYKLSTYDAEILTSDKDINDYFYACAQLNPKYKALANWIIGPIKSFVNEQKILFSELKLCPNDLSLIVELIDSQKLNYNLAVKEILPELLNGNKSILNNIKPENLDYSTNELNDLITDILNNNSEKVTAYKKGKKGLLGFFMGELMNKTNGILDPKIANELLRIHLDDNKT